MATTQSNPQERTGLPYGTTLIGTDTNSHEHRFAGAVTDHRVFICDADEVLEIHDLDHLAAEGVLERHCLVLNLLSWRSSVECLVRSFVVVVVSEA
ncbi:hypothetical protein C444_08070, partial [Haloarcula japonica DSM 6131]